MVSTTLTPIGRDDYERVRHISLHPEQVVYSGTVAMAFSQEEAGIDFHAVLRGNLVVGFFKIDLKFPKTYDFCTTGDIGLRAFMIDRFHQGQGIGLSAMQGIAPYLATNYPSAQDLVLTVDMRNDVAVRCYQRAGFISTSDVCRGGLAGPQFVMRLPLR